MTVRSISARQTRVLRHALLRPHQPAGAAVYPNDTGPATLHVGAFAGGELVGVASVFSEPPAGQDAPAAWRLRGMATLPAARGAGHAGALLLACVGHAARLGGSLLWCNARTPAAGFYARYGFARVGAEFDLPPIGPHWFMRRPLTPADVALALVTDPAAEAIETERLLLRAWRTSDVDAYAALHADPDLRHVGPGRPLARDEAAAGLEGLIGHWEVHGFGRWAVEERSTARVIGCAGLSHPPGWPDPELGWLLARDRRGQGYATEAGRAALAYGFGDRRVDRVTSITRLAETAAQRVAARLGMRAGGETTWRGDTARWYVIDRPPA